MTLDDINDLTKKAYDVTADKYHAHFKDEIEQKEYDRLVLEKLSGMLLPGSAICDAGCGPSGHIGKYLADKGYRVTGIDIAPRCIDIAKSYNRGMDFRVMDMMQTSFESNSVDAILSFYSVIYTPKKDVAKIFAEFCRILRKNGKLLVVVKKGTTEGIITDDWYEGNDVYFTHFTEEDIGTYFSNNGFRMEFLETRKPYEFEFNIDRIYAMGTKI